MTSLDGHGGPSHQHRGPLYWILATGFFNFEISSLCPMRKTMAPGYLPAPPLSLLEVVLFARVTA